MHNQFCKRCGQANFPDANVCTKCGTPLERQPGGSYGQGSEPPPTMMAGQQYGGAASAGGSGKSNTKYFVFGGIALVLVLLVGLIGIAGIGAVVYFSGQEGEVAQDDTGRDTGTADDEGTDTGPSSDDDDSPLSDIEFPAGGNDDDMGDSTSTSTGKVTDAQLLQFFLKEKATVGKFSLKKVTTTDSRDKFPNRTAGATAEYTKGSSTVIHEVALYDSASSIKEDFDAHKAQARKGGRIQTSKETSIIYVKDGKVWLAFYNPQGGFHVMSSRNGNDILEYHNAYFGVE